LIFRTPEPILRIHGRSRTRADPIAFRRP
jgi:hypothetical protein